MNNRDIGNYVGQRIVVDGSISVPYRHRNRTQCIENCVVRNNGQEIDHVWIRQDQNPWYIGKIPEHVRGDNVSIRGVVYEYHRRDGSVGYSIGDIDQYIINGKGHRRV